VIALRRAVERHRVRRPETEARLTFYPPAATDPLAAAFGDLISLRELWLPAGAAASHEAHLDGEVLTYVHEGSLTHGDNNGHSDMIRAGEFHVRSVDDGAGRRELRASATDSAHVYQLCLRHPVAPALRRPAQQQRFSTAQRRGQFCLIVSSDGRQGSLRIDHDARIYSALLEPGQHVVHELATGRSAWLHLVQGAVCVGGLELKTGDGAGFSAQRGLSVTTREHSEVLLVDLLDPLSSTTA
jgi:quercetin 2,3-dioxygenase